VSADLPEGLPIVAHLAGEFYAWLWWTSELGAAFDLPPPVGPVDVWVDERLAFRNPDDTRISAVMTGANPAATLEARAALAGGKVLHEIRLGMRREDREYLFTLKGPAMHVTALKLPAVETESDADGQAGVVFERIHLYDELCFVVASLFRRFAERRTSESWAAEVVPELQDWILARQADEDGTAGARHGRASGA
jgi:hypothetical protein